MWQAYDLWRTGARAVRGYAKSDLLDLSKAELSGGEGKDASLASLPIDFRKPGDPAPSGEGLDGDDNDDDSEELQSKQRSVDPNARWWRGTELFIRLIPLGGGAGQPQDTSRGVAAVVQRIPQALIEGDSSDFDSSPRVR